MTGLLRFKQGDIVRVVRTPIWEPDYPLGALCEVADDQSFFSIIVVHSGDGSKTFALHPDDVELVKKPFQPVDETRGRIRAFIEMNYLDADTGADDYDGGYNAALRDLATGLGMTVDITRTVTVTDDGGL